MPELQYYVKFFEHSYEISPPEDGEGEWLHQGDYGLNVTVNSIHRSQVRGIDVQLVADHDCIYGIDDIPAGQPAHLVVVEYTTGGTFGSYGAWTVAAVLSDAEKALEARERCEARSAPNEYRAWDGYFERLNSAEVVTLMVSP